MMKPRPLMEGPADRHQPAHPAANCAFSIQFYLLGAF